MLSRVLAVSAAVLGSAALVLAPAIPAAAAAPTTYANVGTGGDVNYLPSTQKYAGMTDNQRLNAMAQEAYAAMKTQEQTDSVVRFTGGNGITTQTSPGVIDHTIETVDGEFIEDANEIEGQTTRVRTGGLVKGLGVAGEVMGGYALGTAAVNGVGALIGLDPSGYVCRNTGTDIVGQLVRVVDGASCGADPFADSYKPNQDATGSGLTMKPYCFLDPALGCIQVTGTATWAGNQGYCYAIKGFTKRPDRVQLTFQMLTNAGSTYIQTTSASVPGAGSFNYNCPIGTPELATTEIDVNPGEKPIGMTEPERYNREGLSSIVPFQDLPSNPSRQMKCVTLGTDGQTYTGKSATYTDLDKVLPTPQCADLPPGVFPQKIEVQRTTDGKTDTDTLGSWDTDQDVLDWQKTYPACTVHSLCNLSLQVKTDNGWKPCRDGEDTCADWFTSPNKNDAYRCMYGIPGSQSSVSIDECDIYQNRWTPEAQQSGNTLSDPKTGRPLSNPKPTNNPKTDAAISNRPASNSDTRAQCFPSGWGAVNPVNWVMQPVTCAMENLFVPKPSAIPSAKLSVRSAVNNSGLGTVKTNVAGLGLVSFGNGCSGLPVEWDIFGNHFELDLLKACAGDPLKPVANATHTILAGLVVTVSLLAILRYMAIIFGFQGLGTRIERAREDVSAAQSGGDK